MQMLIIAGNVGKDAVLRRTQGGDPVLSFSLAVDTGKDRDGNKRPAAWYDCSIWGKRAEALERHITKGSKLTVQGRPTARAHEGKAYLGVSVSELTFMGGGGDRQSDTGGGYDSGQQGGGYGSNSDLDDEIPW